MRIQNVLTILFASFTLAVSAQEEVQHITNLTLGKKEKKVFSSRDSSLTIAIDTLIMGDKSSLQFLGKKDVKILVKHAIIGNNAVIYGSDGKNNAADIDFSVNLQKLGSLYILAAGQDAFNGTRTHPNGNGGNVTLRLAAGSIVPQQENKKAANYLSVATNPGGQHVNASSDLRNIYSQIKLSSAGLRGVPQGQIYSGSAGKPGKLTIVQD
ncbi:hypothetical protein J5U18_05275 [Sphingobacteriaceae bacterium WQ 2009]|uniref:Auto-transporter adhesin head GIN domain-containing protein n=1 Tax=Rhinopithecimicrobium faecis TaxID=2820698 RepID=A0A8T4H7F9_9SPHI|nr:hypothetical protein [Sphingobacteriaceae bacterium WQ 2009]